MNYKLTLYKNRKKSIIIECENLQELDKITATYKNKEHLLTDLRKIYKIENISDSDILTIEFLDRNGYKKIINPLYNQTTNKLDPKNMTNYIIRYLKEKDNYERINDFLEKYIYMFLSPYNIRINKIQSIKNSLRNKDLKKELKDDLLKKILKLIKNDLLSKYNKETKNITNKGYENIRIIYNYINVNEKEKISSDITDQTKKAQKQEDKVKENNCQEIDMFDEFINSLLKENNHYTMGEVDYFYREYKEKKLLKRYDGKTYK